MKGVLQPDRLFFVPQGQMQVYFGEVEGERVRERRGQEGNDRGIARPNQSNLEACLSTNSGGGRGGSSCT